MRIRTTLSRLLRAAALCSALYILPLNGCATYPSASRDALPAAVQVFLEKNGSDFLHYGASDLSDPGLYYSHRRLYIVQAPLEKIWEAYISVNPRDAWDTPRTRFGVLWDPASARQYVARDRRVPNFAINQIYILELLITGFYRIPVAFEISRIDGTEHVIEFTYSKNNLSNGRQSIAFRESHDAEGRTITLIEHRTWYRSGKAFRDKSLYAPFHSKIIDAFHRRIFRGGGFLYTIKNGN